MNTENSGEGTAEVAAERRDAARLFLTLWIVVWLVLLVGLYLFWHSLPAWVSWPLAILEAFLIPDMKVVKKYVIRQTQASS